MVDSVAQGRQLIPVRNIYYMLAYAFQTLDLRGFRDVGVEDFENIADLCAAILSRGIDSLLKRGLGREYVGRTEPLSALRGKIEVNDSIKTQSFLRRRMVCSYDDFSIDTQANRAIKATMNVLLRSDAAKARKKDLKRFMVFFAEVGDVDPLRIDWEMRFGRNDRMYRALISLCRLACEGLVQTQDDGSARVAEMFDEQRMCRLYEKFILEYYRREHPELSVNAACIDWALDDGFSDMLPAMRSDIMLSRVNDVLIIDAKYYEAATQQHYGKKSIHSGNLYQIFTYVKNKEAELAAGGSSHKVSGMLLYAKTDEDVQPCGTYLMSGNKISVATLDLNLPFGDIRSQLDAIAQEYFGKECG